MIPLRDTIQSRNFPIVNTTLIAINVGVFFIQLSKGPELSRFFYIYGLVPARYFSPRLSSYFEVSQQVFSFLSFMFLHGGFLHILGNMWSLYIFGDNVEDRMGHFRFLVFYLLCGMVSGLAHMLFNMQSNVPTIGASGAIAGVMGAYFVLYPHSRILTLIPIIIIPYFVEIPAFFFLGLWLLFQILYAVGSHGNMSGIAWWAHIGGFVFGVLFLKLSNILPSTGISKPLQSLTEKKHTHLLQVVHPSGTADDPHLHGVMEITPREAITGTRKLISIPWGFYSRTFRVTVPAGVVQGSMLRLREMGRQMPDGNRSDLLLRISIVGDG
jgi:hypothetical protein